MGEVRGEEAVDMSQALNTGHEGSMSTGHANSAADMLSRLENMVLMGIDMPLKAIRQQLASGIDIIVHLGRLRDRSRRVLEITEVLGLQEETIVLNPLFWFQEEGVDAEGKILGRLERVGELMHVEKIKNAGLCP